tara:strand:- start:272 stop:1165 length:894 start_codon:yes stop_codon:yes gene_type:complete
MKKILLVILPLLFLSGCSVVGEILLGDLDDFIVVLYMVDLAFLVLAIGVIYTLIKMDLEKKKEIQARKKAEEDEIIRKRELEEKYGEDDALLIFNGDLTEDECIHKNKLIKKYGENFGMAVFNREILTGMTTEMIMDAINDFIIKIRESEHVEHYFFGKPVRRRVTFENGKVVSEKSGDADLFMKGMTLEMVHECIGKHNYQHDEHYYFGQPFRRRITFENGKLVSDEKARQIWQNMSRNMLVASWGNPEKKKETVYKNVVKLKWFYGGRRTRQNTRVYKWRVDLENNLVVGWKELE